MTVHVLSMRDEAPRGALVVDTTTRSQTFGRGLSPMLVLVVVPAFRHGGEVFPIWHGNVENVWQYSKVYSQHWDDEAASPTAEWFLWSEYGKRQSRAERYPMGKGARPVGSWWGGQLLGYIDARKAIYLPVYADCVMATTAWQELLHLYRTHGEVWLRDFDGYDHIALGMSLDDVLNDPTRKMGHAFVLARLLEGWK